jgi:hypothetical protein
MKHTMMEEVEATVNPQASFSDWHIFLRFDGPMSWLRDHAADFGIYAGCHSA